MKKVSILIEISDEENNIKKLHFNTETMLTTVTGEAYPSELQLLCDMVQVAKQYHNKVKKC